MPTFIGVGHPGDTVLWDVLAAVRESGSEAVGIHTSRLSEATISIENDSLRVADHDVSGLLFRAAPYDAFSEAFRLSDRRFVDVELRAAWLAAINLDSVLVINRFDASTWFDDSSWIEMRRVLGAGGVELSPLRCTNLSPRQDDRWLPYRSPRVRDAPAAPLARLVGAALLTAPSGTSYTMVGSELLGGPVPHAIANAHQLLLELGMYLTRLHADARGRLLFVDPLPPLDSEELAQACFGIVREWHGHLRRG